MRGRTRIEQHKGPWSESVALVVGFLFGLVFLPSVARAQYRARDTEWPSGL